MVDRYRLRLGLNVFAPLQRPIPEARFNMVGNIHRFIRCGAGAANVCNRFAPGRVSLRKVVFRCLFFCRCFAATQSAHGAAD